MRAGGVMGRGLASLTVALIVLAVCAGCGSAARPPHRPAADGAPGRAVAANRPPVVVSPVAASPVVANLVARASASVVYVLGRARRGPAATLLFRSDNAGRSFFPVSAPVLFSARGGGAPPVRALTFISPAYGIAVVGTPAQREPLLVTDDGARTWHRVALGTAGAVWAVAGGDGRAYALVLTCVPSGNCHGVRLYRSTAGSLAWSRVPASGTAGAVGSAGISLAAWGRDVWLTAGNGQAPAIGLLASANSGATFYREAALTAIACRLSASATSVVWVTCSEGMSLALSRFASGVRRALPVTGAGTGNTFLDPLSASVAIFGTALGQFAGLSVTRNGGRSFTRTGRLPGPFGGIGTTVTFLTAGDGFAVLSSGALLRTADGGTTWAAVRL
jgi:hypothetical protein